MTATLPGIHHVTAITADAQKNLDFYTGVLGLRLVKLTVNFDDPGSYHLYYGDATGRPGTIMTFFAWNGARPGRIGPPQVAATAFSVAQGALEYWRDQLPQHGVAVAQEEIRFGQRVLGFADPDGLLLEIVEDGSSAAGAAHAIRSFYGVTLWEVSPEATAQLLTRTMGFRPQATEQNRQRFRGSADHAAVVDVVAAPTARRGAMGPGAVHHVAFRTPDGQQQEQWLKTLSGAGYEVSPVMDRNYFHSIYFREPGGVLFEIATDPPGFTADEEAASLGTTLKLPPWLEPHRAQIEGVLPSLQLPQALVTGT